MPQFEIMAKIRHASQHYVKPGNPEVSKGPMRESFVQEPGPGDLLDSEKDL